MTADTSPGGPGPAVPWRPAGQADGPLTGFSETASPHVDPGWIRERLLHVPLSELVADHRYASGVLPAAIRRALLMSAHVVERDPDMVPGQLVGRLRGHPARDVAGWVQAVLARTDLGPWLVPLTPVLDPVAGPLVNILAGDVEGGPPPARGNPVATAAGIRAVEGERDGSVRVWEVTGDAAPRVLSGHRSPVVAVAITPDGGRAVSAGHDGSVRVWDLTGDAASRVLSGHHNYVLWLGISADGRRVVSSGGSAALTTGGDGRRHLELRQVRVWDTTAPAEPRILTGPRAQVESVAISADGTRAVSWGMNGPVWVWEPAGERPPHVLTDQHGSAVGYHTVAQGAISGDGTRLISCGWDETVRVWDLTGDRSPPVLSEPTGCLAKVAISADGTRAVALRPDGIVRVWDLGGRTGHHVLPGAQRPNGPFAISADGTRAVIGGDDGSVWMWDLIRREEPHALPGRHDGSIVSIACSADGNRVVAGGGEGIVWAWDLAGGTGATPMALTGGHRTPVWAVAVCADGNRAVSGSWGGSVRVWDLTTGHGIAHWVSEYPVVHCVVVSDDPLRIGVGQRQGVPYLLELRGDPGVRPS